MNYPNYASTADIEVINNNIKKLVQNAEEQDTQIKSKEPAIGEKNDGFNLKKTDLVENDTNKVFTPKGAFDLKSWLVENYTTLMNNIRENLTNMINTKTPHGGYGKSSQDLKNDIDTKLNHTDGYGKNIGLDKYRKVIPNAVIVYPGSDNSVLDTIAVHLTSGWNSSMLAFDLKVRAYNTQSANLTISFTGYPFGGNKAWHGVHVRVSGGTYEGKIRAFTTTHPSSGNPLIYFNFPNKFDYMNCGIFNALESVNTSYQIYTLQGFAGEEVPIVYNYSTSHKPTELGVSRNITIGDVTKKFNGGSDLNYTYDELRFVSKDKDEIMNGSLSINTIFNVRDANGTHTMLMTSQNGVTWLQGGATGLSQKMEISGLNASNLESLTLRANEVKFNGLLNMKSGSSAKYPNNMVQYSDEYAVGFMNAADGTWRMKANKNGGVDIYGNSSTTGVHTIYSDHNALTLTGRTGASPLYILARDSGGSHLWDIGKLNSVNDLYIENLVYGTQLVLGQNEIRTNKIFVEAGQRVYSPNNKPSPFDLGCFPFENYISGSVSKTFIGVCQVGSGSSDYADVGGGSQHFLMQMTTERNHEPNAYVGQIAWGYDANNPKIAIRCKTPGGDGRWEHLVRAKDLATHCPYRVGDIFDTTNAQHPAETYLGTQWERYGDGKVIVGLSESESEFNTIGKTGGSKAHSLTISEMPPHTHPNGGYDMPGDPNLGWPSGDTSGSNTASNTGTAGGGQPHNNLQPYIVAYRWRRIA